MISPILSNLYLHPLDRFIQNDLQPRYTRGESRQYNKEYAAVRDLSDAEKAFLEEHPEAAEMVYRVKHNAAINSNSLPPRRDPHDPDFRRLYYVRYVDDFIIGFIGPKSEAMVIRDEVMEFLAKELELSCNPEKSKLQHSSEPFTFLGARVR